MYEP